MGWRRTCCVFTLGSLLFLTTPASTAAAEWAFKSEFWPALIRAVPGILGSQDAKSGRFGKGIWIVNDQHPIFPLAVVWALPHPSNPYYHDDAVLAAIMAGGDALIDDQDERGMWEFRKKDGSTWGPTYMVWTYSRWVRAFGLIRELMPPDRRARWETALTLGYDGISKTAIDRLHNIPAHHAMGLFRAGQLFSPLKIFVAVVNERFIADAFVGVFFLPRLRVHDIRPIHHRRRYALRLEIDAVILSE